VKQQRSGVPHHLKDIVMIPRNRQPQCRADSQKPAALTNHTPTVVHALEIFGQFAGSSCK